VNDGSTKNGIRTGRDEDDSAIVSAVISRARDLSLATVAEKWRPRAIDGLRALGSDFAQGYLFAKPQPLDDLLSDLDPTASRTEVHAPQI